MVEMAPGAPGAEVAVVHVGGIVIGVGDGEFDGDSTKIPAKTDIDDNWLRRHPLHPRGQNRLAVSLSCDVTGP